MKIRFFSLLFFGSLIVGMQSCNSLENKKPERDTALWQYIFDGETLEGWRP